MKASRGVVVVLMALLALLSLVGTCDRSRANISSSRGSAGIDRTIER